MAVGGTAVHAARALSLNRFRIEGFVDFVPVVDACKWFAIGDGLALEF